MEALFGYSLLTVIVDFQILVGTTTGVAEDAVGGQHLTGVLPLAFLSHDAHAATSPAVLITDCPMRADITAGRPAIVSAEDRDLPSCAARQLKVAVLARTRL